ncbi:hypothetical protein SGPA1_21923 [Streptomyces misionensis JCM 4497]
MCDGRPDRGCGADRSDPRHRPGAARGGGAGGGAVGEPVPRLARQGPATAHPGGLRRPRCHRGDPGRGRPLPAADDLERRRSGRRTARVRQDRVGRGHAVHRAADGAAVAHPGDLVRAAAGTGRPGRVRA